MYLFACFVLSRRNDNRHSNANGVFAVILIPVPLPKKRKHTPYTCKCLCANLTLHPFVSTRNVLPTDQLSWAWAWV